MCLQKGTEAPKRIALVSGRERDAMCNFLVGSPPCDATFKSIDGHLVEVAVGSQLTRTKQFAREPMAFLIDALSVCTDNHKPVSFIKTPDTQAVEQNWRYLNRHKLTLHNTGPRLYRYLLHRLGHLLNERRWKTEYLCGNACTPWHHSHTLASIVLACCSED